MENCQTHPLTIIFRAKDETGIKCKMSIVTLCMVIYDAAKMVAILYAINRAKVSCYRLCILYVKEVKL